MDCTGSMDPWMRQARDNVKKIIDFVQQINRGTLKDIKIGFLAYRDLWDGDLRFETKDFTDNIDDLTNFIGKLKATGGDDGAEDVIGALTKMRDEF